MTMKGSTSPRALARIRLTPLPFARVVAQSAGGRKPGVGANGAITKLALPATHGLPGATAAA
jgi:hypothetical protein